MLWEQLDSHMQNNKSTHRPYTFHKNELKMSRVKGRTIKLLEESTGESLGDLGFSSSFVAMTPKAQATEEKLMSWTSFKLSTSL